MADAIPRIEQDFHVVSDGDDEHCFPCFVYSAVSVVGCVLHAFVVVHKMNLNAAALIFTQSIMFQFEVLFAYLGSLIR